MEGVRRGEHPDNRLYFDGEMAMLFFLDRRYRSAASAKSAYEHEEQLYGEPLRFDELEARGIRTVFVAETLGLIARWSTSEHIRSAAAVASSGIRSSFFLWLEDDNQSMGVLRDVVESIARIRTHVLKPERAARLEERGSGATPQRWLEAAGCKSLSVLNAALGELAHTKENSKWHGVRDLLVSLVPEDDEPELAPYRGRRFALDSVVRLAGKTALEPVESVSPEIFAQLTALFGRVGILDPEQEKVLEDWPNRTLQRKGYDLGEPMWTYGMD
jgi:hypothetical protein